MTMSTPAAGHTLTAPASSLRSPTGLILGSSGFKGFRGRFAALASLALAALLAGCATGPGGGPEAEAISPSQARARALVLLPANVPDRQAWATDLVAALVALDVPASAENLCAVIAVTEQESTFRANPTVPNLAAITWREIDARAERAGIPSFAVRAAMRLDSPNGKSYAERIDKATTELELSRVFEDFIGMVPLGKTLFGGWNPVRTGGPMQVSIAYAEQHAKARTYPYPLDAGVRSEVFTRRGGLYFGAAHLLDYPARYDKPIYRFADFNAGHYASRNAAFQQAVSLASGIPLALDGDLIDPGRPREDPGSTERATRVLKERLDLSESAIRRALEDEKDEDFADSALYERVFALAEKLEGRKLPRAVLPEIALSSPKITRKLTTAWFARRVDERHQRCMARADS
jgi:hypothetical protein